MPPSLGWIVQPAHFASPPDGADPWAVARSILAADEQQVPMAIAADFDTIWIEDHLGWGDKSHLECLTTLAFLAGRHAGARWGTMVCSQGFRNPAYLAKVAVNLQLLTEGRFILGLGAGNNGGEHREFGYPFEPTGVRMDQLDEAARVIRALWRGGRQTFRGRYHRIEDAVVAPRPDQPIPLMIGGGGERRTLRIVADLGDWWCADVGTVDAFARKSAVLTAHCEAIGRDPGTVTRSQVAWVGIAGDGARDISWPEVHIIHGGVAAVTDELLRFRRAGVDHFQLRFMDFPSTDGFTRFIDDVLPQLREGWG